MNDKLLLEAYRRMLQIRLVEERLVKEYLEKNIRSFVHFYIGQEAIAVGVCMNLSNDDYVFSTHRSHGHYLAKGGDLKAMLAELQGKATGCSRGRGGSMHLIDKGVGFMGSISILSSVVPIAVGAGFALKKRCKKNVCVVFIGDGAADEGGFYESVNLAALMEVPVIFVVENNLYAATSDMNARHPKEYSLMKVVFGLGGTYFRADGNDVEAVYDMMKSAKIATPCVIECQTFRHMAHSGPTFDDKLGYRKSDDWDTRIMACPVKNLKAKILSDKITTLKALDDMANEINREIDEALKFADESPYPKAGELMEGVYYD